MSSIKKTIAFLGIASICLNSRAQTLFTFGTGKVDKQEFLRAYNKNNPDTTNRAQSIKEYLDLYIKFKLKVQAAKDLHLDTLPDQKAELLNYENQLQDNYLSGESFLNELVTEAIARSKTDIEIAHLFIPVTNTTDTAKARQNIEKAYKDLQAGLSFKKVVDKYITDSIAKSTKGYIGFVTVFSLPYNLETILYNLKSGSYTAPYKSKSGYHIFTKLSERKAWGSVKAAQILLAYAEGITEEEKQQKKYLADSIYKALLSGASFEEMVKGYSEDKFTYQNKGELPLITVGKYDINFEKAVYGITKDSAYAPPVETSTGIHIIRRLKRIPVNTDASDPDAIADLQQKVRLSDRMLVAQSKRLQEILKQCGYKKILFDEKKLWTDTDSALKATNLNTFLKEHKKVPIFSFAKQVIYSSDWLRYIKVKNTGFAGNPASERYSTAMKEYVKFTVEEYYKKHLEEFNPEYKYQVQEFKEGNLLFEVMERNIWSKASADSAGLIALYMKNKKNYKWEPSVAAIIITCNDAASTEEAIKRMKTNPGSWRSFAEEYNGRVLADSGRFEMSQIPIVERTFFEKGLITLPLKNEQDGSAVFAYIVNVYQEPGERTFEEARGLVINDYQQVLEDRWIEQLKKKYPVKIDDKVLAGL
ncbi:MAG TPA: peptidylprolyl isomerase [Chitinophagaceae bacterium]|nr:peptidylprolyl isomerase [Chitinophagaceae bacterium]